MNLDDLLDFKKLHKQLSKEDKTLALGIMIGLTQKLVTNPKKIRSG